MCVTTARPLRWADAAPASPPLSLWSGRFVKRPPPAPPRDAKPQQVELNYNHVEGGGFSLLAIVGIIDPPREEAIRAVAQCHEAGIPGRAPLRLITNTTRQPRRRILDPLRTLGFDFPDEALTTAPSAIRAELEQRGRAARFFVHPDLLGEFEGCDSAARDADVVVPGDMGEHFSFATLSEAFRVLMVGDDYAGHIDGVRSVGLAACLFKTGKYRVGDEDRIAQTGAGLAEDLWSVLRGILQAD